MKNQAFSHTNLNRLIRPSDFSDSRLTDELYREKVLRSAVSCANDLFAGVAPLEAIHLSSKKGYKAANLSEKLVLRKILHNLRQSVVGRFKHRDQIASELAAFLKEGSHFRVYRLDIKSFFESIPSNYLFERLESQDKLSTHTKHLVIGFLKKFYQEHSANGLPRGVEISSTLSEIVLSEFDEILERHNEVFYWARYVDDIVLITSSSENKKYFLKELEARLPGGLIFNRSKQKVLDIGKKTKDGGLVGTLEFLGYEYSIVDSGNDGAFRTIKIDLSSNKIVKFKTRISQALYSHKKSNDFRLLHNRITFLASNRDIVSKKNRQIATGIYYSYPKIDPAGSLAKILDPFLRKNVRSSKFGLSVIEKDALLKISFSGGFKKRTFKDFSPNRLVEISRIWK